MDEVLSIQNPITGSASRAPGADDPGSDRDDPDARLLRMANETFSASIDSIFDVTAVVERCSFEDPAEVADTLEIIAHMIAALADLQTALIRSQTAARRDPGPAALRDAGPLH